MIEANQQGRAGVMVGAGGGGGRGSLWLANAKENFHSFNHAFIPSSI